MPRRPNILFFFTDQQRWDSVGCYGSPMALTPNLDRLAARGVRFEHAFTCQPVCAPARGCLQTGLYATAHGVFRNQIALPAHHATIARQLAAAGYETGYIGKWHLSTVIHEPVPREQRGGYDGFWEAADVLEFTSHPFDGRVWDADNQPVEWSGQYRADFLTGRAEQFIARPRARPFFLFLSYIEPHHQNDLKHYAAPEGYAERYANPWVPPDLRDKPGDWQRELPDYYGCIARLDECLGRLVNRLEALGQLDNTLIVFTTDHGSHFRTRNGEYKRSCHEASIRIPMVMAGPGCAPGLAPRELASLIDLPPTLLDLAGAETPAAFHGRSLAPLLRGERPADWPEEVFIQISEAEVGRAIRTERWKYGVFAPDRDPARDAGSPTYVERYLYDLAADPHESVNLIGRKDSYRAVADGLMRRLKRRMAQAGEPEPEIIPARYYA